MKIIDPGAAMRRDTNSQISVLDLTIRLPGPLAGAILHQSGAKVSRPSLPDPFILSGDEVFRSWAKHLNAMKCPLAKGEQDFDLVLIDADRPLPAEYKTKVLVRLFSNRQASPLHDINLMAQLKAFAHFGDQQLPFLPFLGTSFSFHIVNQSLLALLAFERDKHIREVNVYFEDLIPILELLGHPSSGQEAVHLGSYPCYGIYELKDGNKVAIACLNEDYWQQLGSAMGLTLHSEERFDKTRRIREKLENIFLALGIEDLKTIFSVNQTFVTPIKLKDPS